MTICRYVREPAVREILPNLYFRESGDINDLRSKKFGFRFFSRFDFEDRRGEMIVEAQPIVKLLFNLGDDGTKKNWYKLRLVNIVSATRQRHS
jgi:hypothetical protein